MSRRPTAARVGLLALVLVGCTGPVGSADPDAAPTSGPSGADHPAPSAAPGPEAVDLRVVPLPVSVAGARFPSWSADGERIVFSGRPEEGGRDEVMTVAEDGSDLRCLTCAVAPEEDGALLKPIAFTDGRRIVVRVGEQSPVAPADHAVLECRPSVAECTTAELVPIVPPAADDPEVRQDQREVRVAPDGETVALSQVRARPDGDTAFLSVVGTLRRTATAYVVDDARVVSTLGELKAFTPDGRAVLVAAFTTLVERAANPDIVRVDLATGDVEAVTVDGDYDEDISFAPDQRSYVVASGRGADLFETVSQVPRPAFVGPGLEPLTAYLFTHHHRRELLEPWVVAAGAEASGEEGQQLNPGSAADGYDGRTLMTWHPEGDRILFWEGGSDPFGPPEGTTRIVVAALTDRAAAAPRPPTASPSSASWAPALAGFAPPPPEPPSSRAGEAGGSATVTIRPGEEPGATRIEVRYDGFTDDGMWIVDGTESVESADGFLGSTTYRADLAVSGDHGGFLRADAVLGASGIEGSIESEVDGRNLRLPR